MKTITTIAVPVLLSLTAQAQDTDQAQSRLKPPPPAIALDYEGKDFFSEKKSRLQKPEPRYTYEGRLPSHRLQLRLPRPGFHKNATPTELSYTCRWQLRCCNYS